MMGRWADDVATNILHKPFLLEIASLKTYSLSPPHASSQIGSKSKVEVPLADNWMAILYPERDGPTWCRNGNSKRNFENRARIRLDIDDYRKFVQLLVCGLCGYQSQAHQEEDDGDEGGNLQVKRQRTFRKERKPDDPMAKLNTLDECVILYCTALQNTLMVGSLPPFCQLFPPPSCQLFPGCPVKNLACDKER